MAEGDSNRTLWIAVAGITATALVGLAGTAASWWSARDDRAAQRSLAHDERIFDRRVSAYLDAISFVEGQKTSLDRFWNEAAPGIDQRIPYHSSPPSGLLARLRAFGSADVLGTFEDTEKTTDGLNLLIEEDQRGREVIVDNPYYKVGKDRYAPNPEFVRAYRAFKAQVLIFEDAVHAEVG